MRYALLVGADETAVPGDEERSRRDAALGSFLDEMARRGVLVSAARLRPAGTAATVRCWDGGDVMVSEGPLAAAREQVVAVFVIESESRDQAIEVATKVPAAWYGAVEVRPVQEA